MTTMLPSLRIRTIPCTTGIADERLRAAAKAFIAFKSKLMKLNAALRTHHQNMVRTESSRAKVIGALSDIIVESPIADLMVTGKSCTSVSVAGEACLPSYGTLQTDVSRAMAPKLEKYEEELISYVDEWERTVSTRIYTELKYVKKLQSSWIKCESKVEALRSKAAAAKKQKTAKGEAEREKLKRNETKLRTAKKEYRRNLICVTLLVEEVTERGWKDLVPLMIKMMNFDTENAKESANLIDQLAALQTEMKDAGTRYGMHEEVMLNGRLQLLQEEDATEFVSPEDMEDLTLEPTIASVWSCSRATTGSDSSREGVAPVHPVDEKPLESQEEDGLQQVEPGASDGNVGLGRGATGPPASTSSGYQGYLPQSFYVVCDGDGVGVVEDDLTTLTPYTRCERRISI